MSGTAVPDDNMSALLGAGFDSPPGPLRRLIVVAATARTGSHLLCRLLLHLRLGVPCPYFGPLFIAGFARRWQVAEGAAFPRRYLEAVMRHRTVEGTCAIRCMDWQYPDFAAGWRALEPPPNTVILHLWRRDSLAQAISYRLARRSGYWDLTSEPLTPPQDDDIGDLDRLRKARRDLVLKEMWWRAELLRLGVPTLHLAYEDLVGDRSATLRRVVAAVAPQRAGAPLPTPTEPTEPQGLHDRQNVSESERRMLYRRYCEAYGAVVPLAEPSSSDVIRNTRSPSQRNS